MSTHFPPDHRHDRRRRARAIAITQQQPREIDDGPSLAFATAGFLFSTIATIMIALALSLL